MAFDIAGARKSGYSDTEIADFMAGQSKFDAPSARQAGYSDTEIITHLSQQDSGGPSSGIMGTINKGVELVGDVLGDANRREDERLRNEGYARANEATKRMLQDDIGLTDLERRQKVESEVNRQKYLSSPVEAVSEVARQGAAGVAVDAPAAVNKAAQAFSPAGSDAEKFFKRGADYFESGAKEWEANTEGKGAITKAFMGGARAMPLSGMGMAAAGASLLTGSVAAPLATAGGIFALFGGSQFTDTYEKGLAAGLPAPEAKKAALLAGGIEGLGETVGDYVGGKFLVGLGRSFIGKLGVKEAESLATDPRWAAKFAGDFLGNMAVQAGTEYGQGFGETAVENRYGISNESPIHVGKEGAITAAAMSLLMSPGAVVGHQEQAKARKQAGELLQNPFADVKERANAAEFVRQQMAETIGKEKADEWHQGMIATIGLDRLNNPEANAAQPAVDPNAPTLTRAAQVAAQGINTQPAVVPQGAASAADVLGTPNAGEESVNTSQEAQGTKAEQSAASPAPSMSILTNSTEAANGATATPGTAVLDTAGNPARAGITGAVAGGSVRGDTGAAMAGAGQSESVLDGGPANAPVARHVGRPSEVVLPDNTTLPAQWEVVDADQVTATLKEGKNQPRDRSRAASNAQVQGIANAPDYRRLSDSPVMDIGAPTLSHDGAIVGGNGRFEGVSRAYDQGTAGDYIARLKADAAAKGIDPAIIDGMKKPVLVRRVTQPFDTRSLAVASNSGGSLQYSALELAKIDGERMASLGDVEVDDNGDIVMTGENMGQVRRALSGYSPAELGSITDKDGLLSQEGIRRLKNAMLYKAYGSNPTLSRLVESADNDMRAVSGALVRAAGAVAKVRADVEATDDIASDVVSAVEKLAQLKQKGQKVEQYLAQHGLFGKEMSEEAVALLKFLSDNIRSQKRMAEFLRNYYNNLASKDTKTAALFGDEPPITKRERLSHAIQQEAGTEAQARPDSGARPQGEQTQPARQAGAETGNRAGQQDTGIAGTKAAPVAAESHDHVKLAEQNVNTSPTEAQKDAGNYAKAHIIWNGLPITIENPAGSERSGTDSDGERWSVTMPASYGYIKRTEGADGDHVDVYLGKHLQSDQVFIIDQKNLKTGEFDEHKVMLGFPTQREAERIYKAGFSDRKGAQRMGAVTPMSVDEFKDWLRKEDTTKPAAETDGRAAAQADMQDALAEMGAIWRDLAGVQRLLPEQKAKLMPVLVKMFDAAFRLGYYEMKDATRYVREQLAKLDAKLAKFLSNDLMDEAAKKAADSMPRGFFEGKGLFAQSEPTLTSHTNQEQRGVQQEADSKASAPEADEGRVAPSRAGAAPDLADHVQDRMTNADKKSDSRNFKLPALHEFVPSDVLQRVHDLIAKAPKENKPAISTEDRAAAEAVLKPMIEKAEKAKPEFDRLVVEVAQEVGIGEMLAKIKKIDRAAEKMVLEDGYSTRDLFGRLQFNTGLMRDLLRATVVVESVNDVSAAIAAIGKRFAIEPGRIKDNFAKPTSVGYRGVLVNVLLPGGAKAEIQVNIPSMLAAKDVGHKLYEISRNAASTSAQKEASGAAQRELYAAASLPHPVSPEQNLRNASSEIGNENLVGHLSNRLTSPPPNRKQEDSSGSAKNTSGSSSISQKVVPLGNLAGNSEAGNLSGSFISGSSKHTIAKNASGDKEYNGAGGENTTGANHANGQADTRGNAGKGAQAAGRTQVNRKSGSVRAGEGGGNLFANQLPGDADSGASRDGQGGRDAKDGDLQQRPAPRTGDRAGRATGIPAGRDIPAKTGRNYRLTDTDLDYKGGWLTKATQNVEAVELVKKLEAEKRDATREEQAVLAKFIGWGASEIRNQIFDPRLDARLEVIKSYDEAIANLGDKPYLTNARYSEYMPAFRVLQAKNPSLSWYAAGNITKAMLEAAKPDMSLQKWAGLRDRLKAVMSGEEWATAERSTQYAHYTGKEVVDELWRAVGKMGFKGGLVLEPGAGNGVFPGRMPAEVAANSAYTGIEMDELTGAILKYLQPDERILVESYIDTQVPDNFYDVAIGNPPFSGTKILSDARYKKHAFALHDYFFAKTIDKVKPGGLMVFVTSRYTMDKQGDRARQYLFERADLLGAIRLPETAFKKNAGTEVVTDILFLRKKVPGETFEGHNWLGLEKIKVKGGEHLINEYFAKYPDMVLGEGAIDRNGQYRENQYTVLPNKAAPIAELLAKAIDKLPADVFRPETNTAAHDTKVREFDWNPKAKKEGSYYVSDSGQIMQVENRAGVPVKIKAKDIPLFHSFIVLRDAINQAQYDQLNNGAWEASLEALRKEYRKFVAKHGNILQHTVLERKQKVEDEDGQIIEETIETRRFDLLNKLDDDPEYSKLLGLEKLNDETGEITEGDFLKGRVLDARKEAKIVTPHDALLSVLNDNGKVDMPEIARRMGLEEGEVIEALGSAVYDSPSHGWQTADEYLSGNVKQKLQEAEAAAKTDRRYARNVEALLAVQPRDLTPADITASIGMSWIPAEVYEQFLMETAGVGANVIRNEALGSWQVKAKSGYTTNRATVDWGTNSRHAGDILEHALTGRPIRVTKKVGSGSDAKTVLDADATEAANQKMKAMREEFQSWVWRDEARTAKLLHTYNDQFNNMVARSFDGRHLTLPGTTSTISVFDHVKRGAWRIIQTGNTYLAHAVGSGKTWQMVISAMEQKRLGMINKPMMVVPNHMLQQFAQEWLQLYPAARLLVADEKQFAKENRRRFVARAAMSDLDGVIITQSAFKLIDIDPAFKKKMIDEEIAQMEAARDNALEEDGEDDPKKSRNPLVRDIQKRIENLEEQLKAASSGAGKDQNVRFDEMGVDMLYVDEAHLYRKLSYSTARQVKGISPNGSQYARDLYIKTRWLEEKHPGRSLVMASGTPITNTMAEMYSVQRFMQPKVLEERGLLDFDSWASMFGQEATEIESDVSGNYAPVTRFSKFVNVPELTQMFREFADVLTSEHLAEMLGDKRPKLKNGTRQIVVTPQVDDYLEYKSVLAERVRKSKEWKPSKDEPNNPDPMIRIIGDGRLAAIDMRFIDPSLPSNPNSKLNVLADGVIKSYRKYEHFEYNDKTGKLEDRRGATQMVFSDIGFGEGVAEHRGFNARAWFEKRLRDAGIPMSQVAFMSDYKKSDAKRQLFKDVNSGKVRILVGSSKNMGTGVNAQQRLRALHHLDTPWFPADLEQREGRIVRQGNKNRHVRVFAYSTKDSYDRNMWQLLARKQRFIDQALSGDSSVRSLEDISEAGQYAMAMAMTAGDERIIRLAGMKADLEKYNRLYRAHEDARQRIRQQYSMAGMVIESNENRLAEAEKAAAKVQDLSGDRFSGKVGKTQYDKRKDFGAALLERLKHYTDVGKEGTEQVGEISGFPIMLTGFIERDNNGKVLRYEADLTMKVEGYDLVMLVRDPNDSDVGLAMRATNALAEIARRPDEMRRKIADAKSQRNALENRLDSTFQFERELADTRAEIDKLEAELVAESAGKSMTDLEAKAKAFAEKHHGDIDQRRKFTDEPYIVHPQGVVEILKTVQHTPEMLAAAWAHDTVEDTKATIEDVRSELGDKVGDLVEQLTMPIDFAKLTPEAQTIKLADIVHNVEGLGVAPEEFSARYKAEKLKQLGHLKGGSDVLLDRARRAIESNMDAPRRSSDEGGPLPEPEWLSEGAIAEEVEKRLAQFAHQPAILIRDSERSVLGDAARNDGIASSGMVYRGQVHLFRDGLSDTAAVARTLWHELLHYGLRRFLTKEQYISEMNRLYLRDAWIRQQADAWMATDEAKAAKKEGNPYARARGVDEALAALAEVNEGEYQNNGLVAKAIRSVADWIAKMAERFGFNEVAARWRSVSNTEARQLVQATFRKMREDSPATSSDWAFNSDPSFMVAWHGSPHDHNKFDSSKIGTGEGAQTYGYGHYFAGKREVAEWYRNGLSYRDIVREFRNEMPDNADFDDAIEAAGSMSPLRGRVIRALADDDWLGFDYPAQAITAAFKELDNYDPSPELRAAVNAAQGQLYQVELAPMEEDYLLWDKPLSEQSEKVRAALKSALTVERDIGPSDSPWVLKAGDAVINGFDTRKDAIFFRDHTDMAGQIVKWLESSTSPRMASEYLHSLGIRGIKYLDGGSRSKGEGDYNYVIFDDADITITHKNDQALDRARKAGNEDAPLSSKSIQSQYEIPNDTPRNLPIDSAALVELRRAAAGIESPERGITFTVNADGRAIVTGPARTKVPARFERFAEEHGLTLVVRRASGEYANANTAMPPEYREAGALYFGEMGDNHLDRTGRTRFSQSGNTGTTGGMDVGRLTRATAKLRASWHGFRKVHIVQSVGNLPNELYLRSLRALKPIDQGTEGLYDPVSNAVYLIADNIRTPERAAWVAAHEVAGHAGLRMLDKSVAESLDRAGSNGFVRQLARAIAADRGEEYSQARHTDEAVAELAAGHVTGNMDAILDRYKIKVPMGMRSNLVGMIARFVQSVRAWLAKMAGSTPEAVSDAEVYGMLTAMRDRVEGKGSGNFDRKGLEAALASRAERAGTPEFRSDIPSAYWLDGKMQDVEAAGRDGFGVPKRMTPVTGSFDRALNLPVDLLEKVPGERGEQSNFRSDSLQYIRDHWDETSKQPVYIEVDPYGKAWVSEGNHRIMVAKELGVAVLPVEVKYFTGGELKAGEFAPEKLIKMHQKSALAMAMDAWGKIVDEHVAGTLHRRDNYTILPATPASMQIIGMPDLPVIMKGMHALDYIGDRITAEQMKRLPEELADPQIVFAYEGVNGKYSLNFVTGMKHGGRHIVVALHPNDYAPPSGKVHYVATVMDMEAHKINAIVRGGGTMYVGDLNGVHGLKQAFTGAKRENGRRAVYVRELASQRFVLKPTVDNSIKYKSGAVKMIEGGEALFSVAPKQTETQPRILRMAKAKNMEADTSMLDKIAAAPFKLVGWNRIVEPAIDRLLERAGEFVPEKVKAGMISDYGLGTEYTDRKAEMKAAEAAQNRKSAGLVEMLAALTRAESRVAYQWMQEKPSTAVEQALLEKLPAESRETLMHLKKMISDMGAEAVRLGQLSAEAYARNNMAYLHRTYAKHVLEPQGAISRMLRARALRIKGNQYKGRGIFDEVRMDAIGGDTGFGRKLQQGRADASLIGEKLIRFERRDASAEAMDALPGMVSKPLGRLHEVVYWPADEAIPAKFGDWVNAGEFEVRGTKGDKLVVWRDFTKEERTRMGELDEVRYAVAQTLQMITHDIEVGRFFNWVAKTYGKAAPEGKETTASESMLRSYGKDEWVHVPAANIPGTQVRKYGALAGLYVPGTVWNDIRQTAGTRIEPFGATHEKLLQFWKKAKTAWSPAVHMNNVMANFVIADWHDLRSSDLAEALKVWALNKKDGYREMYHRFEDSGALGGMFLSNEALRDEIAKQLEAMKGELTGELEAKDEMTRMAKVMHLVTMAGMVPKAYASGMESAYQFEDAIFRLASFLKAVRYGKSDIEAGRIARHSFLNYDINAPWIQVARHTALPFVSFFYRALPMAVNTAKSKPWKVVKLLAFWQLVSLLGYMGSGGDEDEERKSLPKEKQGRVWGVVPKMVRMPWNHEDDAPVFLDIRRWVPVGDIADLEMGAGMLPPWATPSGPLLMLAEVLLMNKSMFTEKEIVQDTDTQGEKLEKRLDHLFKGMMPNVPLPNPLNLQLPAGEINPAGLRQGSAQSYAWAGIERSMLKREGQIGEVRTTPAAIASAVGIKVSAYPAGNMEAAKQIEKRQKVSEIRDAIKKIQRDFSNLANPTEQEQARYERDIERQRGKLEEVAAE